MDKQDGQNKIYVIGDSHVNFFSGQETMNFVPLEFGISQNHDLLTSFKTFYLGAVLAYSLNRDNSQNRVKEKVEYLVSHNLLPKGAYVLCCFGEIDLRFHVFNQAKLQNVPYQKVVDDILKNYAAFLQKMIARGYKMICWGPVASQKDKWMGNKDFPAMGTELERNQATKYFNRQLEKICADLGATFVSIFDDLVDENGKTKEKYFMDPCHLSQRAMVLVKDKFAFFAPDISVCKPHAWQSFVFHKYKRPMVKVMCLFVPLHKWRKKIREYFKYL